MFLHVSYKSSNNLIKVVVNAWKINWKIDNKVVAF